MNKKMVLISPQFRREAWQVVGRILLFVLVYIVLLAAGFFLASGCVFLGGALIVRLPRFLTLMLGLGLMGLGAMVFFFLIKFLFSVKRTDRSDYLELRREDQPELFALVDELAVAVGTSKPRHLYVSADVNAAVFYDSSFWSMFFPVRKNLVIGLGLVNSVNRGELKAVLAHEFGHFSQDSMKLGSFVYQVNHVIYNMLYDNEGYAKFLQGWATISNYFAFFASITVRIVQAIQYVLRQMFRFVNKGYSRLSREMEFHADAVAAAVSGGNNLTSALEKLPVAGGAYQQTLDLNNQWLSEDKVSHNFYAMQQFFAGRPGSGQGFKQFLRINYRDQWASHPNTEDRVAQLAALDMNEAEDQPSAWTFFRDAGRLQQEMTSHVYEKAGVSREGKMLMQEKELTHWWEQQDAVQKHPALFNDCFAGRMPANTATGLAQDETAMETLTPETLFTTEATALPHRITAAMVDAQVLEAIAARQIETESFDFDGRRRELAEIQTVLEQVQQDRERLEKELATFDQRTFQLFYKMAAERGEEAGLAERVEAYNTLAAEKAALQAAAQKVDEALEPARTRSSMLTAEVQEMLDAFRSSAEAMLKKELTQLLSREWSDHDADKKEKLQQFVEADLQYFHGNSYIEGDLRLLFTVIGIGTEYLERACMQEFASLLAWMAPKLVNNPVPA